MDSLNINEQISVTDKIVLKETFNKYYVLPERPNVPEVKAELKLIIKDTKLIYYQPRQLSFTEKDKLQVILKDWELKGIIRRSDSEYASPMVLVKKKNGEIRPCVNFRALNKVLARDNYPIPLIEVIIVTREKIFQSFGFTKWIFSYRYVS